MLGRWTKWRIGYVPDPSSRPMTSVCKNGGRKRSGYARLTVGRTAASGKRVATTTVRWCRCLTSDLIRSLVRHLERMVLQLHEYLMRCLSDMHTSPHQRKRPRIMVQKEDISASLTTIEISMHMHMHSKMYKMYKLNVWIVNIMQIICTK